MLFTSMILVQIAAGMRGEGARAIAVWLGLDVAFDVYIGVGTIFLAVAVMRHEWFGRAFGLTGLAVAVVMLVLNLATFPTPPANAGLFDMGPFVGLWYLAITIASLVRLRQLNARAMPQRTIVPVAG
jgi:hypothetical protein